MHTEDVPDRNAFLQQLTDGEDFNSVSQLQRKAASGKLIFSADFNTK